MIFLFFELEEYFVTKLFPGAPKKSFSISMVRQEKSRKGSDAYNINERVFCLLFNITKSTGMLKCEGPGSLRYGITPSKLRLLNKI